MDERVFRGKQKFIRLNEKMETAQSLMIEKLPN